MIKLMTRENAKALLPIIEAYAKGDEIEVDQHNGTWKLVEDPTFLNVPPNYRIKPKPREWWIFRDRLYSTESAAYSTKANGFSDCASCEVIHVIEAP